MKFVLSPFSLSRLHRRSLFSATFYLLLLHRKGTNFKIGKHSIVCWEPFYSNYLYGKEVKSYAGT